MRAHFTEGRRGIAFRDGKLYEFTSRHVLVMAPWPAPLAWWKRRWHDWRPTRWAADELLKRLLFPAGEPVRKTPAPITENSFTRQYLLPGICNETDVRATINEQRAEDRRSARPYFDLIPADVRAELLRYSDRRWHVMSVLARCPGAMDLCRSNQSLLCAIASNWDFRQRAPVWPMRTARRLVRLPQRRALEWLGFPGTEMVRRILAKIETAALGVKGLRILRAALLDPAVGRTLSHCPRIGADVLALTTDRGLRPYVTPSILLESSADAGCRTVAVILRDTIRMAKDTGRRIPDRFFSVDRLNKVHQDLIDAFTGRNAANYAFPDPPHAGTPEIEPIQTHEELIREGRDMRHCVASHAVDVARGHMFFYRVKAPVRFTLSLWRDRDGWSPGEAAGVANQHISEDVIREAFDALFASTNARAARRVSDGLPDLLEMALMPKEQQETMRQVVARLREFFGPGASSHPAA